MASRRCQRKQETHFKIMQLLQDDPSVSTREIARRLCISNGAAYYCIIALIDKGYVKLRNFTKSKNKTNLLYELTPAGIHAKAALTVKFLDRKRDEFNDLKKEIERLEQDLDIEVKKTFKKFRGSA